MNFIALCKYAVFVLSMMLTVLWAAPSSQADDRRGKRDHHRGVTGPVHTFVKTDKNAHFKWGVRHHVGHQYAGK